MSTLYTKIIATPNNSKQNEAIIPSQYRYYDLLTQHLGKEVSEIAFNGELIYPRQIEVQLGNIGNYPCNLKCVHCQGSEVSHDMADNAAEVLQLIKGLKGVVPFYIFGGVYNEPLLNKHVLPIIRIIKANENNYGIHTNGTLLAGLQRSIGFISELFNTSNTNDYITISIDSGREKSFMETKRSKNPILFQNIIRAIEFYAKLYEERQDSFKLRLTYLLNEFNSSAEEIQEFVSYVQRIGPAIDSLRFSIPYLFYGRTFEECYEYQQNVEIPMYTRIQTILTPLLTQNPNVHPLITVMHPGHQDYSRFTFQHCFYGYYQITLGADGYVYRCSAAATPEFKNMRLGKLTGNVEDFNQMILANQTEAFDPTKSCFPKCIRCNRMGISINETGEANKYGT